MHFLAHGPVFGPMAARLHPQDAGEPYYYYARGVVTDKRRDAAHLSAVVGYDCGNVDGWQW